MLWWKKKFTISEESYDNNNNDQQQRVSLVIYDISDNKRRTKIFKILKSYGIPVQRSSFECRIDESDNRKMIKEVLKHFNPEFDLLRIYRLNSNYNVQCWGNIGKLEIDEGFWIV